MEFESFVGARVEAHFGPAYHDAELERFRAAVAKGEVPMPGQGNPYDRTRTEQSGAHADDPFYSGPAFLGSNALGAMRVHPPANER